MYALSIILGPDAGRSFFLTQGEVVSLGREGGAGVIAIDDPSISRRHITIEWEGDVCFLRDLGSLNGTQLNGRRISREPLKVGDVISLGETSIRIHNVPAAEETSLLEFDPESPNTLRSTIEPKAVQDELLAAAPEKKDSDTLQRVRNALAAVCRAGQRIHGTLQMDSLLRTILQSIVSELPGLSRCFILLLDGKKELVCRMAGGTGWCTDQPPFNYSRTLAGYALRKGTSILLRDVQADNRFGGRDSVRLENIRSAMCVPISGPEGVMGLLQVDSVGSPAVFTEDDLRGLTMLGLQAGAAIANARLYENLGREKTALADANRRLADAQKQLIQNEKMAAVGELAAGIVHDIKTPLTIMRGYAHLLREQCDRVIPPGADARQAQENLKAIDDAVTYCTGIINQLLQFARQVEPVKMPVRVGELVQGVLKLLQAEFAKAGIGVEDHIGKSDPSILADPGQLQQVFMNILVNSIQATPKGGRVRVGVREERDAGQHWIVAFFEDTGAGMTEDEQRRVFDPFYTNKKSDALGGGVGLGLAVSHGIVQNHGGAISVRSEKGVGTIFYVKLPVGDPSMPLRFATRLMGA